MIMPSMPSSVAHSLTEERVREAEIGDETTTNSWPRAAPWSPSWGDGRARSGTRSYARPVGALEEGKEKKQQICARRRNGERILVERILVSQLEELRRKSPSLLLHLDVGAGACVVAHEDDTETWRTTALGDQVLDLRRMRKGTGA